MSNDSTGRSGPVTSDGYAVPITGLLALLFALMAGGSAYPAIVSGSLGTAVLPVIFAVASLFFFRLRQRYDESKSE